MTVTLSLQAVGVLPVALAVPLYDTIEGFTFDEGTSYVIDVTIDEVPDPPADGSSLRDTLVQIVEATESTN